ncbi:OmpA family protein [uncultured Dokdonia sp.]|uniref:OmpA family protein n=1 Tax=Dokdonia sp. R78006 TaxID=3093866 RepID=UPI00260B2166|nr:OmpA family protein [uncultured Dokdonia sp.]
MKGFMRCAFVLVIIFSTIHSANAQQGKLARANKKFNQLAYIDAIEIYKDLVAEGFKSYQVFNKIAEAYYYNGKYSQAQEWYGKLTESYADSVSDEHYFRYAQTLRAIKEYDKSDEMMQIFADRSGNDFRAKLFKENPDYTKVEGYRESYYTVNMIREMNSRYSDFGPSYYKNQVIFASARDTGSITRRIHKWNNQPFLDLYKSTMKEDGSMSPPSRFHRKVNTIFHESTPTFTKDGKTMYFTRNNFTDGDFAKSSDGINKLKIYKSTLVDKEKGSWSEAVEVSFNEEEYATAHPALSADGKTLYFSSDRPGSVGLSDIWKVAINGDGSFGEPENLGKPINTEGRDAFPFMSSTGNLYYASDGYPGLGGLDIFVTNPSSEEITVASLGEPINSSADDFAYIVNDTLKTGFFSSSRNQGMGSDDIYRFKQKEKPEPRCDVDVLGFITDAVTKQPITDAKVQLMNADNEVVKEVDVNARGLYRFSLVCSENYVIRATSKLYYAKEVIVITPAEPETLQKDIELELRLTEVGVGDDLAKLLNLNPIYFDYNKSDIRPDAALELTKVISAMKQVPDMVISVRSHTDSRGKDDYNLSLSDRRAKSTVAYIISRGIDASRISGQGYGETELVNNCDNNSDCTEEQHQLNRRSEFIVITQ